VPSEDDYWLARNASRYLTTDHVTPPQAETYRPLLLSGPSGDPLRDWLPGMSREGVERYAADDLRSGMPPKLAVDRMRSLYGRIDKVSHRWLKGMMAAALALDDERPRR
jgi:hypothetical protein